MHQPKTVVLFSGGIDSTTMLFHLRQAGHEVLALCVDYGQRHRTELSRAARIAEAWSIPLETADLRAITRLLAGSSQTDPAVQVPLGHYTDESMKATVVPNRNMIMLAVAAGWAITQQASAVAYGAHSGDHAIYPDCRPQFADALALAISLCDWRSVELIRPFVNMSKTQIVTLGHSLGVPFARTWSCYQGESLHCGACGTCIERREAFLLAGVPDPTDYSENAPAMSPRGDVDWSRTITGKVRA
ncbi:MAG: 7-cyano-7-deazaguanine synthase QueC [Phycisphaeraceae bacterium]|nr:7-cyano-7-deazaguanine synthase QueC [Phycisphaeraceae bacterium]